MRDACVSLRRRGAAHCRLPKGTSSSRAQEQSTTPSPRCAMRVASCRETHLEPTGLQRQRQGLCSAEVSGIGKWMDALSSLDFLFHMFQCLNCWRVSLLTFEPGEP